MNGFTIYKTILIAASMLAELKPRPQSPEAELLVALYPALRRYEDSLKRETHSQWTSQT